jgi:FkbM family methyltransferase
MYCNKSLIKKEKIMKQINIVSLLLLIQSFSILGFTDNDQMLRYVKQFIPANPTILEAGGNLGEDTRRMKRIWPHATMHVFEPLPWSFKTMIRNNSDLARVHYYEYALTNYIGITNFYVDIPNNGSSSIGLPLDFNRSEFDLTPLQIKCTTLDQWAQENNVDHIDFMWLDMESHELYALKHALNILPTIKAIFTEVAYEPVREGSALYPELRAFLEANGFHEVWKCKHSHRFGDALFIKKELLR